MDATLNIIIVILIFIFATVVMLVNVYIENKYKPKSRFLKNPKYGCIVLIVVVPTGLVLFKIYQWIKELLEILF